MIDEKIEEKACLIVKELMEMNNDIPKTIWISIFYKFIAVMYCTHDLSYQKYTEDMQAAMKHLRAMWDMQVDDV